jgi:glyoxylase-like metal-dependent hydrolase (beta-lactamase superfamily II)
MSSDQDQAADRSGGRESVDFQMTRPELLDLVHVGRRGVIGSYLLETGEGPALVDCGPATCVEALAAELAARGLRLADVRHLLLTHIHLDHAGAAGVLVRAHADLTVHVSGVGAPHLVDPSRLERSARRLYGDEFDRLWGELVPVPEASVRAVGAEVLGLEVFPAPGHASHHVCYSDGGTLYAGDAAGVRVLPGAYVLPPTPPPDVDVDVWLRTIDAIERRAPERLALSHFGVATDVGRHLDELRARLLEWRRLVEEGASEDEFVAAARTGFESSVPPDLRGRYAHSISLSSSYLGLKRHVEKRAAA